MIGNVSQISQQPRPCLGVLLLCLCICCSSLATRCYALSELTAKPANTIVWAVPSNQVLDRAEIFAEYPDMLSEVVDSLSRMKQDYNYSVYLVVCHNVLNTSLRERADNLYESWVGESGRGMVIVYQLDPVAYGDNPAIVYHKGDGGDGLDFGANAPTNPIPERDVASMLGEIIHEMGERNDPDVVMLKSLVLNLENKIIHYHDIPESSWADSESVMMIAIFSGFVIVIPLIGLLIRQSLVKSSDRANQRYYFPDVQVGIRLGAPYGGGWVSEKSFSQSSPQPSHASRD